MIPLNLLIFLCTLLAYVLCFRHEGKWSVQNGLAALRFFTILSNLLCAASSLLMALFLLRGQVPFGVWLLKYIGTVSVAVTFVTVMVFLGPAAGYKAMLSGKDLYLHLIGPLLAIASFCFTERLYPLTLPLALLGDVPVLLYGLFYLYKVVLGPDTGRWDDFYGYNKDGKWPISFTAMIVGGALLCVVLWLLYRL